MADKIETEIKNDQLANVLKKEPKVAQELAELIKESSVEAILT